MNTGANITRKMIENYERGCKSPPSALSPMICFDMDGTIADLYSVPNWLEKLKNEDPSPYVEAAPLVDMERLREVLLALSVQGYEIRVISWLAKNASKEYKVTIRKAKREWLERHNFPCDKVHIVAYGTNKASCVRKVTDSAVLIDDDCGVRDGWHIGRTIDPANEDILEELEKLSKTP